MDLFKYLGPGERVDTYLSKHFGYSRNFFHHIIGRGGVKVQSKAIKKSYKLKENDEVMIDDLKRYFGSEVLAETPDVDIPIVLEKEDYLVINKPKGVLSHPKTVWEVHEPSVAGFLYHRFKNLPSIGDFIRAGILHRLDKGTDGLMIVAKTEKGLKHFKALFQSKSESDKLEDKENTPLKKFYRATSYITKEGQKFLDEIDGKLPYYIQEIVVAKVPHVAQKEGITKIIEIGKVGENREKLEKRGKKELVVYKGMEMVDLKMEILTGRTHQIRYHLSSKGLPIVGDWLYGFEDGNDVQLTAYKLMFEDLDGKMVTVEI